MMRGSLVKLGSKFGGAASAIALTAAVAVGGVALCVPAASAKEEKAKPGGYSKEFVAAAAPIQKTLNDAQALKAKGAADADIKAAVASAPAQLAAAEAVIKTPQDRMTAGQWGVSLGGMINDIPMRQRGIKNMLDSGLVPAANVTEYQFFLGNFAYSNKDFPAAIDALTKVVQANYKEDTAAELLADSYAQQGKNMEALQALKMAVDARKAAGAKAPTDWYKRANLIAYKSKLGPQAIEWSTAIFSAWSASAFLPCCA